MGGTTENEGGLATPLFLFDENITGVGRALRWVWGNLIRLVDEERDLGRGADDFRDVIPWCAAHGAILFSFDRGFVQRPDYIQAVEQAGVRVVLVQQPRKPKRPRTHAEILWMVARALVLLERGTAKLEGSFATISAAGLPKTIQKLGPRSRTRPARRAGGSDPPARG